MSIPALPSLDRTSPTFRTDLDTFFLSQLPATTGAFNSEIDRINAIGYGSYNATSTTSLTIGEGSKSLTVEPGRGFVVGQALLIASTASPTNYMSGQVTSYDSSTGALVVNVTATNGSGALAAWTVSITALVGRELTPQSFVASGSISLGGTVALNASGTVSAPAAVSAAIGTDATLPEYATYYADVCTTTSGLLVAAYYNNATGSMRCVAATVGTGGALTFGTEANSGVNPAGSTSVSVTALNSDKFMLVAVVSSRWYVVLGEVNPATRAITLGSGLYVQPSGGGNMPHAAFDPTSGKVLIAGYSTDAAPNYRLYVGTVSGLTLSLGTAVDIGTGFTSPFPRCIGEKKFVIFGNVSSQHCYKVATVSGTSATVSAATNTGLGNYTTAAVAQNPADLSIAFAAVDSGYTNTKFGFASVAAGTPSFGTSFLSSSTTYLNGLQYPNNSGAFDAGVNRFAFWLSDTAGSSYGRCVEFKPTASGMAFVAETVVVSASSPYGGITYSAAADVLLMGAGTRKIRPFKGAYTTATKFIGFAQNSVTDGQTVGVATSHFVDDNQTGLSTSKRYYVADNGTLTTNATDTFAGTALSATNLLIKG